MKHKRSLALGILSLSLLCGVLLYSCFAPPTNTPCTPIEYPNGNKLDVESGKIYTFETNDAYADVVAFYETTLNSEPRPEDSYGPIIWDVYPIREEGVLFECFSILDGILAETGCIYVSEKYGKGAIDMTWSYAEVEAAPCYVLPGIEPEDYLITR